MKCKICSNSDNNRVFIIREMMFGYKDEFTYIECSNCGCLQILEFPADMSKYYPANYSSFNVKPHEQFQSSLRKKFKCMRDSYAVFGRGILGGLLCKIFPPSNNLLLLSKITSLTKKHKILDIGCGTGWLLYALKEIGFENILGVDPYLKSNIKYSNGLMIIRESVHNLKGEWDLIMFHHSFEHIPDPIDTLVSVSRLLSIGGICLINTPTVSSYAWKHYGTNWVQIDAPRHFFLHSIESIKMLAKKANLTLTDIVYNSTEFQFLGSEQYLRNIPLNSGYSYCINPAKSIFSRLEIDLFKQKAEELNLQKLGDTAVFYLKK